MDLESLLESGMSESTLNALKEFMKDSARLNESSEPALEGEEGRGLKDEGERVTLPSNNMTINTGITGIAGSQRKSHMSGSCHSVNSDATLNRILTLPIVS